MNNNIENDDSMDDGELEKKDLKSIIEIAQSYSISTISLNKAEIIEKIKSIVKRKREYEEEQKQKQNVNSFNKINKLTITDNIEPTEILFWKLFRNIVIYKKIFSFIDNRFSLTYDSMSSINKLIDSNQFGIIKEKVYRNCRYLLLNPFTITLEIEYLLKLFSTIKIINRHAFVKEPNYQTVSYSKEFLKFMDWMYTNYNNELKNGGFTEEIHQYHLLISIGRFDSNNNNYNNNNNNDSINKYYNGNEEENDVYIQRLRLLLNNVIQLTPHLFEVNNFKFLNWLLTFII
ncbi:hypothetical protein DDB_G0271164 [Dictyostelium discoideum AX4]|uniref:Rho termination factor N-terminal domain-containing protein n=1 Tax=Dictyostelium discoideum TaxID=44689 RepID=Q55B44_DICDI|nr:hypothetical protein DDB_G0271164 [Dictyostelium discoideum AX4]EAL71712.1 hypothetical protein DDB_G0271164 [Dictyostelium discoideum AX4]|eukprot:XP_645768.1 hypothetical protein DDB_G0271164 [Dictyostelium discoideum AX4]